jgi:phosphatidylserine/phosphatidylglycerophosphate/cardiolipin synthase-like enzyme
MAKFLDTNGVSHYLQQLINGSNEKLILISPFLKISERLKQSIQDRDRMKIDIRIIYDGKKDLEPAEENWLKSLHSIRTSFCQNLHAKCYLNEKEAIITSMNLYEFSQVNNHEMGIYVEKNNDAELYASIYEEAMRLVRNSDEIKITVPGHCIRCKTEIKLNPMVPYCGKCYASWKKINNDSYQEKYCHICGKPNSSSKAKPGCYDCYKANKDVLEFPLQYSLR